MAIWFQRVGRSILPRQVSTARLRTLRSFPSNDTWRMGSFWIAPLNLPISMPSEVAVGCVLDARYEILASFMVIPWDFHRNSSLSGHWIRWPQDVAVCKHGPATIAQLHQSLSSLSICTSHRFHLFVAAMSEDTSSGAMRCWCFCWTFFMVTTCELIDLTSRSFRFTSGASLVASNVYHMDSSIAWLSVVLEGPRFSGWTNPSFQWLLWLSRDDCEYQWLLYNSLLIDDMGFYYPLYKFI